METGDLSYVFWSWEHGEIIRKPHVITNTHTHTHMQIHGKKQKLHKPQEPNIAVAHFSTGLCVTSKNKGSLQRKKKVQLKNSLYIDCTGFSEMTLWILGDGKSWCYISYQMHAQVGLSYRGGTVHRCHGSVRTSVRGSRFHTILVHEKKEIYYARFLFIYWQ